MFSNIQSKHRTLDKYMPLVSHATDHVALLRDGSVMVMFELDGLPVHTLEDTIIYRMRAALNHALCGMAMTDGLVLYSWVCRGFAPPSMYPTGRFYSSFAQLVDQRYKANLFNKYLYLNRTYVGVMIRPSRLAGEWIGDQVVKHKGNKALDAEKPQERINRLLRACSIIKENLRIYRPKMLGLRYVGGRIFTEIGEALAFAMTGVWRSVGLQAGHRFGQLFNERIITGGASSETLEIRGAGFSSWAACFGAMQMPESCPPGNLDEFLSSSFCSTIAQSFRPVSRNTALTLMGRKQNHMIAANDRAHSQILQLSLAMDEVQSGRMVIGDHSLVVTVFTDSLTALPQVTDDAFQLLQNTGCQVAREDRGLEGAYFSMLPGNSHLRPRPGAITSWNFASMAAMHAYPAGQPKGHWGQPVMLLRSVGGTPVWLDLHVNKVCNVFLFGESGSGKTAWLAFLITQLERLSVQVVLFDKDRGLEILVRHVGGRYLALDHPTMVAPLKALTNSDDDLHHLARLIRGVVTSTDGYVMTSEEDRRLFLGLQAIMTLPPQDRWLADLRAFLGTSRTGAGARLERFCHGNEYGWIIDNVRDDVKLDAHVLGFDVTKFVDDPLVCGPVMMHLLYRTGKLADGRRLMTIIDEGWKIVDIPAFSDDALDEMKTGRKKNTGFIFATQSPRDGLRSKLGYTIREQCKTVLGFWIERPDRADLKELKFNDRECEIIESLQPGTGQHLLRQAGRSVVAQLALNDMQDIMNVLSGTEVNVRILDAVRARYDDDTDIDPEQLRVDFQTELEKELTQ